MYNIINLIDTVDKVNYGIWSAALINSSDLAKKGGYSSEIKCHCMDMNNIICREESLDMVWAEIVIAALAGSLFYGLMTLIEKRMTFWHPSQR